MFEWLRKLAGSKERQQAPPARHLCRLRHATLHPAATLWTPGGAGGHLGAGALEALEDAGVGGELVVAFQQRAGDPLHPRGVLARIEAVEDFPEGFDPTGLGATQRYLLRGLRRVDIDVESATSRRVPTVVATSAAPLPFDLEPAPLELVAELTNLLATDKSWPEPWLEAFDGLENALLGQWATSLGWRLTPEERLALFDDPSRIAETLSASLESMGAGADPIRRRQAVRRQVVTRQTTAMPDRELTVEADEHGFALFHPSDIVDVAGEDREGEPAARLAAHLERGDVVTVGVAAPRQVRVRVTAVELSPEERSLARGSADFRLAVRHGRLFLGPGRLVMADEPQDNILYADPASWVDVPSGVFQVTVMALAAPPPAVPEGGAEGEERGESDVVAPAGPPEYVARLRLVSDLADVPAPTVVPTL
ncbi:MAG: hypothetical protein H6745_19210 [Deltaproteobacteria bacterium]|nr:hypothetical protein [Deltaproteobacteria bacterium]